MNAVSALAVVLAVALVTACAGSSIIDARAQPIVDRLEEANPPTAWSFEYLPLSPSPFLACLSGVDEVSGLVDLDAGAVALQPRRNAPVLVVTESTLLTPAETGAEWRELRLESSLSDAAFGPAFGEVLAGFIHDGVRRPDLNTTALAAIDIADSVTLTTAPFGMAGDTLAIRLDTDQYLAELSAEGAITVTDDDENTAPTLTVVVNAAGLVTGLVVTTTDGDPSTASDGYVMTAEYRGIAPIEVPAPHQRTHTTLAEIDYPTADESCTFRG